MKPNSLRNWFQKETKKTKDHHIVATLEGGAKIEPKMAEDEAGAEESFAPKRS